MEMTEKMYISDIRIFQINGKGINFHQMDELKTKNLRKTRK